jgi:hypothetical protein
MEQNERPLASRGEVAEFLGIPPATLAQWAHRSIGPKYMVLGVHARYRWSDVEDWLRTQERPSHT